MPDVFDSFGRTVTPLPERSTAETDRYEVGDMIIGVPAGSEIAAVLAIANVNPPE